MYDFNVSNYVIVIEEEVMIPTNRNQINGKDYRVKEKRRVLLKESVDDLAYYLYRMNGKPVEIVHSIAQGDPRIPIYIGEKAQRVFGDVGISKAKLYGFRVVSESGGIGLYGESEYGTSYAIYEMLHRLGCRWFMPTELGEVIPKCNEFKIPLMDQKGVPATEYRGMWQGGKDFQRRNRLGGVGIDTRQGRLESFIHRKELEVHPEWKMQVNGKKLNHFKLMHDEIDDVISSRIGSLLEETHMPSVSLSPGDYALPTEDSDCKTFDPDPRVWEPGINMWSMTDRLFLLSNRIATNLETKYPNVKFGVLAYSNYTLPPVKQEVHKNIVPVIAPIDYNRHHAMTHKNHPNEDWLLKIVKGWSKKSSKIGAYWYGMNLAELSAPNPFITKWSKDIPVLLEHNMQYWMPETMGGWDSMLPGYYLAIRMTFDSDENADDILSDLYDRFYEEAAAPMSGYWNIIDSAWTDSEEYSGSFHGYLKIFTPEVLRDARAQIDYALSICNSEKSCTRVEIVHKSFTLFENFMRMRRDWANGAFKELDQNYQKWREGLKEMRNQYKSNVCSSYIGGRFGTFIYPDSQLAAGYKDASQMESSYNRIGTPMLEWKWKYNPGKESDSLPWTQTDYDDSTWGTTHIVRDTWSSMGHHNTITKETEGLSGRMGYRKSQNLEQLEEGKRVFVWIGATDGSVKLYINDKLIRYTLPKDTKLHQKGEMVDYFSGYCQPALFDVTEAVKEGVNQVTILAERKYLNELGTGGLMGPVVFYQEK